MPKERSKPLTNRQARAIRHSTATTVALAERFGISPSLVSNIRCGLAYPDAGGPIRQPTEPHLRNSKIDRDTASAIRAERGLSAREIAAKYGLSARTVERIFSRQLWAS